MATAKVRQAQVRQELTVPCFFDASIFSHQLTNEVHFPLSLEDRPLWAMRHDE